jgi:hypothetical protein
VSHWIYDTTLLVYYQERGSENIVQEEEHQMTFGATIPLPNRREMIFQLSIIWGVTLDTWNLIPIRLPKNLDSCH